MKKRLALVLAAIMLVTMAACNHQKQEDLPSQTEETEESTYGQNTETADQATKGGSVRNDTEKSDPDYYEYFEFSQK